MEIQEWKISIKYLRNLSANVSALSNGFRLSSVCKCQNRHPNNFKFIANTLLTKSSIIKYVLFIPLDCYMIKVLFSFKFVDGTLFSKQNCTNKTKLPTYCIIMVNPWYNSMVNIFSWRCFGKYFSHISLKNKWTMCKLVCIYVFIIPIGHLPQYLIFIFHKTEVRMMLGCD